MIGRPPLSPERLRPALDCLAAGMNPLQAALASGVSRTTVYKLHHSLGGVYRPLATGYSNRYLDRDQRYEIARLREAGMSIRGVARSLGVSASTVSRELRRNADPKTGRYQPERAERLAWERQRRPKCSKLGADPVLRAQVQRLLSKRLSPEQVSGRLRTEFADNPGMQVSPETIYQSLFVYPRGGLKRELQAALRTGRAVRKRRGGREVRGTIPNAVSIHERPEDVEGRLVPGHHEGDLVMGSMASNSAVGTLVERTTGFLTLLHLPDGYRAELVADALVTQLNAMPAWFAKTLTWDRGRELAKHERVTAQTGVKVYFADPYSPYQRGSNENTNGLLREYLPKGTDLSVHDATALEAIADELNNRPRKRLGFFTPREVLDGMIEGRPPVATAL